MILSPSMTNKPIADPGTASDTPLEMNYFSASSSSTFEVLSLPQTPSPSDAYDTHMKLSPTSVAGTVVDFNTVLERTKNDSDRQVILPRYFPNVECESFTCVESERFEAVAVPPPKLCRLTATRQVNRPSDPVARMLLSQSEDELDNDHVSSLDGKDIFEARGVSYISRSQSGCSVPMP